MSSKSGRKFDEEQSDQRDLLDFVAAAFERHGIRYAVTGSHASMAYGENRFTNDIDIVVELSPAQLKDLQAAFPADRFNISEDGARYAVVHGGQFNVIDDSTLQKVDLIIAREQNWPDQLARRVRLRTDAGKDAWFVSPEDLILRKMDFYRQGESEKHLRDIAAILKIAPKIDHGYIDEWAKLLGLKDIWEQILGKVNPK